MKYKSKSLLMISSKFFVFGMVLVFTGMNSCNNSSSKSSVQPLMKTDSKYDLAAYVWPSCHHDQRLGDSVWPDGEGEWEIIKQATPHFEGHYQPKIPLWGYEPDNDPSVMERWIDAATDHGVNVFAFDWYWLQDGPFLESALNDGFLKARNNEKMKFYIMWANHDMPLKLINVYDFDDYSTNRWEGSVDRENFEIIVDRVIKQYFGRPNYYKIDGKPVFTIFMIHKFIEGFGGVEAAADAANYFREETKKAGYPGLHLQQIVFGAPTPEVVNQIEAIGANSVTIYNWGGPHPENYIKWAMEGMERRAMWDSALSVPFFPNVSIGWDDSPRFPDKKKENIVHLNKTPEAFAGVLQKAKEYCDAHPEEHNLITLFAWNEWIEGSYLLPDMKYGYSYLEAVQKVMNGKYEKY